MGNRYQNRVKGCGKPQVVEWNVRLYQRGSTGESKAVGKKKIVCRKILLVYAPLWRGGLLERCKNKLKGMKTHSGV